MATNNSGGGGFMGFMNSPANIVGLILAIAVVIFHLTVGLGYLWPVVAIAVWGACVAVLPRQSNSAKKSVTGSAQRPLPQRRELNPVDLRRKLKRTMSDLLAQHPGRELAMSADQFGRTLLSVLDEWNYLNNYPEQQVVIDGIIQDYFPKTVESYIAVPQRLRGQAEKPTRESIDVLHSAALKIQSAIGQDNLVALQGQRDTLALQFGKLLDYEPRSETP